MSDQALLQSSLEGLPTPRRGKVRDIYDLGEQLLIIACDRISAYDVVMKQPIPDKGRILTQTSLFWFEQMGDIVSNHLIAGEWHGAAARYQEQFQERAMYVAKTQPVMIECIVRGYLAGSGWKEYQKHQTVCGQPLPKGLQQASRIPDGPIFTPSTKAEEGHDENISFERAVEIAGRELMEQLRHYSLAIYNRAHDLALEKGFILCDTKFEFGTLPDGTLILIDELLTPDSSRYWLETDWQPGTNPYAYDKQYLRDWLDSTGWDHNPPPPDLPPEVVAEVRQRYVQAYQKLTGKSLD